MSNPKSKNPKIICPSQVACDGILIVPTLAACVRCREALKRRANKRIPRLRGERYCEQYLKEKQ